jgi:hypothetical protein
VLVEQRHRDRADVGVAPVQRRLPDAGRSGDLLHRHGATVALGEQARGGIEHAGAVAGGVGALARRGGWQLHCDGC